jgi:hypothetical protein
LKLNINHSQNSWKGIFLEESFFKQKMQADSIPSFTLRQQRWRRRGSPRGQTGELFPSQRAPEKRRISIHYKQTLAKTIPPPNQSTTKL